MSNTNFLSGVRVYLSGPMDFVASREEEAANGWRTRMGDFLKAQGCVVFDPWRKPLVRGFFGYGVEGVNTTCDLNKWTFEDTQAGAEARGELVSKYRETMHVDLRMVDTCDIVIARCPTNIYSVGTPHEISLARQQRKPVLFVSPPVEYTAYEKLKSHVENDNIGKELLKQFVKEIPLKINPHGIPSLWYIPLVGGENFFDGFGFSEFKKQFMWKDNEEDTREINHPPVRPLLRFLITLRHTLPKKWNAKLKQYVCNDDFLLWQKSKI
jgi:hypothetical protein